MKPVTVSAVVARPQREVFDHLAVLADHAAFIDHMLTDFEASGPRAGVGARLRARSTLPGPADHVEFEVVEAQPPRLLVERAVAGGGARVTTGTYRLEAVDERHTLVSFETAFVRMPARERLLGAVIRGILRRGNQRALDRLAALLEPAPGEPAAAAGVS